MRLRYKGSTLGGDILAWLWYGMTEAPYELAQKKFKTSKGYYKAISTLKKRGAIDVVSKGGVKFIQLTEHGELEILVSKSVTPRPQEWDGKWRMIVFDIPEDARDKRDQLRTLLKRNNFFGLQASVYINPHPLNREAILYLQDSGLFHYIRIIKVEEMDNDADLRKRFNLPARPKPH